MSMYIQILDRDTNEVINTDVTTIKSYIPEDVTDSNGNISDYLIMYSIVPDITLYEKFTSQEQRAQRLDELSLFLY